MFLNDLTKLENEQQLSNNSGLIIALFSFVYFRVSMETMASIRL